MAFLNISLFQMFSINIQTKSVKLPGVASRNDEDFHSFSSRRFWFQVERQYNVTAPLNMLTHVEVTAEYTICS